MQEDRLEELLKRSNKMEKDLLKSLYPRLTADCAQELCAQHRVDYYADMDVTILDFAFPDIKIAIYCDGYKWHWTRNQFKKDRSQSRELQLQGWIVLRFAGGEIWNRIELEKVVETILRAIEQQEQQATINNQQAQTTAPNPQIQDQKKTIGNWKYAALGLGVGLALSFVMMLMLLFKPLDSKAYIERGKAKADKGQHFEAIGDYDMAISLNPDNARAYYYRGLAKEKTDRGRGREDLQKALKFAEKAKVWDLHRTIKEKIKLLDFLESLPPIPDD